MHISGTAFVIFENV